MHLHPEQSDPTPEQDLAWARSDLDKAKERLAEAQRAVRSAEENLHAAGDNFDRAKRRVAAAIPVDRHAQQLVSGAPVPADRSHTQLKPNGQQQDYVVLSAEERAKGFVRPVRRTYVHEKCGVATTMGQSLAETYARDPKFYSGTFCCGCGKHFPVGEDGEFVWDDGSKVGT
jgi:hypothetical protein